jgi:glycine cleavage system H protein
MSFHFPSELRYTQDHLWIRVNESIVWVGITDLAQSYFGAVVVVDLPLQWVAVTPGLPFACLESEKTVVDIIAPVTGHILNVNTALKTDPSLINKDPYGAGWMCIIESDEKADRASFLDALAYRRFIDYGG